VKIKSSLSKKGFSLTELMVVVTITLLIGIATTKLLLNTQKNFEHTNARIKSRTEASLVLRTIKDELRQTIQSDLETIELADQNQITFLADIDNNANGKPEKITYLRNGQTITKTVTLASNSAPPWEFSGTQTQTTLTTNLQNSAQDHLFTYYSAIDTELTSLPLSKNDRANVKIVKIIASISIDSNKEDKFETEVYLRNTNNPL